MVLRWHQLARTASHMLGIRSSLISDIPLIKPIAGVRVGMIDGKFIINPTQEELQDSKLDLVLAGTEDAVLMIEGYCDFLTEEQILEAIEMGHKAIKTICEALHNWQQQLGKEKNRTTLHTLPHELLDTVDRIAKPLLESAMRIGEKFKREEALNAAKKAVENALFPDGQEPNFPLQKLQRRINRSPQNTCVR